MTNKILYLSIQSIYKKYIPFMRQNIVQTRTIIEYKIKIFENIIISIYRIKLESSVFTHVTHVRVVFYDYVAYIPVAI